EQTPDHNLQQMIHQAVLTILERFLNERETQSITAEQLQQILEAIISVFTSTYTAETQQLAMEILVRQANKSAGSPTGPMPSVTTSGTLSNTVGTVAPRLIDGELAERVSNPSRPLPIYPPKGSAATQNTAPDAIWTVESRLTPIDRPPTNPL